MDKDKKDVQIHLTDADLQIYMSRQLNRLGFNYLKSLEKSA